MASVDPRDADDPVDDLYDRLRSTASSDSLALAVTSVGVLDLHGFRYVGHDFWTGNFCKELIEVPVFFQNISDQI